MGDNFGFFIAWKTALPAIAGALLGWAFGLSWMQTAAIAGALVCMVWAREDMS